MESRRWMRVMSTGRWLGLAVLGVIAIAGCGGAVEDLSGGNTPVSTAVPTAVPTGASQALNISPAAVTLFAGLGAPPFGCTGGTQIFTVTGNSPPFTLAADGGCLSTPTLAASGDAFTFIAGDAIGTSSIIVTDALGNTVTAAVTVRSSNATFIKLDVVPSQRTDNGDGTFTSVVGVVLTDSSGVAVSDGVPVEFTLVNPVAGVSLTSPGYTNQQAPCAGTGAVAQPGGAFSCIKYAQSLQGTTVMIHARVQTASAGVLEDVDTVTLPLLDSTPAPTTTPTPGQPAAMQFVGATPVAIGVRQSGLPEQSILTFKVTDALGNPVGGVSVTFSLSGLGDETIAPLNGKTGTDGSASVTLTSGIRASTVRVIAAVDSNNDNIPDLFAQSTAVSVFGAPPAQSRFGIAAQFLNVAGRVRFGIHDTISVFANDRYGNAVPPGTAVSFTSNGASVVNPGTTDINGEATATLLTENNIPPSGIVTVLAYTRGEESFQDNNGNGIFDCAEGFTAAPCPAAPGPSADTILTDDLPEPFIDFRPLPANLPACLTDQLCCPIDPATSPAQCCSLDPPLCNGKFDVGAPFELFVDVNGPPPTPTPSIWDTQGTSGEWDNDILVFDTIPVTFSGPLVAPVAVPATFTIPDGGSRTFTLEVHDDLFNPLVGGSTITVTSNVGTVSGSITVPDCESFNRIVDGCTRFTFSVSDATPFEDPPLPPVSATITVTVTSENGNGSFVVATGTID